MSSVKKKRIVVVCPGRGSYTKENLGYLRQPSPQMQPFIQDIDQRRKALGQPSISELDNAESFKPNVHTKGEHASSLIYACAYSDFLSIDPDRYEIVAVTGNSMGWYLALAYGGSLDWAGAFDVVNSMGSMMKDEIIGAQIIYPVSDEKWVHSAQTQKLVETTLARINERVDHEAHISIYLGGYVVIGANRNATQALLKELPPVENYPFQLINHAAFHTPLLQSTSARAFDILPENLFHPPKIPLIDGRGHIWSPFSTDVGALHRYTLGHQVVEAFDFTRAISVALKEFAPDHLVLLGPGASLGGAIGQILIANDWRGLKSKDQFSKLQMEDPPLLAMGRPEQRGLVVKK